MRFVRYLIILVFVCCTLLGFAVKVGLGSHDELIGAYQVHVPFGWSILTHKDRMDELTTFTTPERPPWFAAINLFGGTLEIKILTPELVKAEAENYRQQFKRERGFPDVSPGMHATATPISSLIINDIPFQKVDWSSKGTDLIPPQSRSIFSGPIPSYPVVWGFEYCSLPINNKEIIRCEAKSINEASIHSAEEIVMSLKRRKF